MVLFVLLFILLPFCFYAIDKSEERSISYWFVNTLIIIFFVWTIISLPCVLLQTKFHVPLYAFIGALIVGALLVVFFIVRRIVKARHSGAKEFFGNLFRSIGQRLKELFTNKFFIIMLIIVLFQAGRVTIFQPYVIGDTEIYASISNDIVETDAFYMIEPESGSIVKDISYVSTKYILSTWYSFEAVLSVLLGVESLTLINTILPGYLIIITYFVWWRVGKMFFHNNADKTSLFLIFFAILHGTLFNDIAEILLIWPTYGKHITSMIVMPLLIVEWIEIAAKSSGDKKRNYIQILLLNSVGCAASNMGFLLLPIEISLLALVELINKKKLELKLVLRYLVVLIPIGVYATLYYILH